MEAFAFVLLFLKAFETKDFAVEVVVGLVA